MCEPRIPPKSRKTGAKRVQIGVVSCGLDQNKNRTYDPQAGQFRNAGPALAGVISPVIAGRFMPQILIRNVSEAAITAFRSRARRERHVARSRSAPADRAPRGFGPYRAQHRGGGTPRRGEGALAAAGRNHRRREGLTMIVVADASVAIKWFLPEEGSDDAARLLASDAEFHAPELAAARPCGPVAAPRDAGRNRRRSCPRDRPRTGPHGCRPGTPAPNFWGLHMPKPWRAATRYPISSISNCRKG